MMRLRIVAKNKVKKPCLKPKLKNKETKLPENPYTRFYKKERSFAELLPSEKQN